MNGQRQYNHPGVELIGLPSEAADLVPNTNAVVNIFARVCNGIGHRGQVEVRMCPHGKVHILILEVV